MGSEKKPKETTVYELFLISDLPPAIPVAYHSLPHFIPAVYHRFITVVYLDLHIEVAYSHLHKKITLKYPNGLPTFTPVIYLGYARRLTPFYSYILPPLILIPYLFKPWFTTIYTVPEI